MTSLADYINQQGASNVLTMIRSAPFWWPLSMAVKSGKDILHACGKLGLHTVEAVQQWVVAANTDPRALDETWRSLVIPATAIKPTDMGQVGWPAVDEARHAQCISAAGYQRLNSDANYLIPTEAQLRQIAKDCPSWRLQWQPEVNDCDDFVSYARGWLASHGLGNLAAGKAATVHYQGNTVLYGHAVLLSFSRENAAGPITAWWWEPQTGNLHPVSYARLGATILQWPDRAELVWGDF